jgi:hypothetical protein
LGSVGDRQSAHGERTTEHDCWKAGLKEHQRTCLSR